MECVDEETILALADGLLSDSEVERVETHLDTCETCRRVLSDVARLHDEGAEPSASVRAGTQIGGYTVVRWLGSGATGTVYAARDPKLGREVAVKVVHAATEEARMEALVGSEGHALARLRHPNVLTVHEVGRWRGRAFLVTELVEGRSLREWLTQERPGWQDALAMLLEAGRGLEAAHQAGVVHRDFKPENVVIGADGRPIVMDFGFATFRSLSGDSGPTGPSDIAGTPEYMAPEHAAGHKATPASDQYSFCAVARECFSARWDAEDPPPAPPRGVFRVLDRGLRDDPVLRFPDMAALLDALDGVPRARRRRAVAGLAVIGTMTAALLGYAVAQGEPNLCSRESMLGDVWSSAHAARLGPRWGEEETPLGRATWAQAVAAAARFAKDWDATRNRVCSDDTVAADPAWSTACLELGRIHFEATLDAAGSGGIEDVGRFRDEVLRLEAPNRCASAPPSAMAWPEDAPTRREIVEVRRSIAHARALLEEDDPPGAAEVAAEALSRARRLQFEPVRLEALLEFGRARAALGDPEGGGIIASATDRAAFLELHRLHGGGLIARADLAQEHDDIEAARTLASEALAVLEPLGSGGGLARARAHGMLGGMAYRTGEFERALEHAEAAARVYEEADDPRVAAARFNVGSILQEIGRHRDALAIFMAARDEFARDMGPDHPNTGRAWHSVGSVHNVLGQPDRAFAAFERAEAILASALGVDHIDTLKASFGGANALLNLGRVEDALERYERCTAALDKNDDPPPTLFVFCSDSRSKALEQLGRTQDARASLQRAYEVAKNSDMGTLPIRATIPFDLSRLEFAAGDKLRAIELMLDARDICRRAQWDARELCEQVEAWLEAHAT